MERLAGPTRQDRSGCRVLQAGDRGDAGPLVAQLEAQQVRQRISGIPGHVRTAVGHHKLPAGTVFSFTDGHATFMDSGVMPLAQQDQVMGDTHPARSAESSDHLGGCAAVAVNAISHNLFSSTISTTRVTSRTFEYDSRPSPKCRVDGRHAAQSLGDPDVLPRYPWGHRAGPCQP